MLLYVDSNVFLSYFLGEFGKGNEFMEERVRQFLMACHAEGHELVISDWMVTECGGKHITIGSIRHLLGEKGVAYREMGTVKTDFAEAQHISQRHKTHWADALHLALARRAGADCFVTWNKRDFEGAGISVRSPDGFIQISS